MEIANSFLDSGGEDNFSRKAKSDVGSVVAAAEEERTISEEAIELQAAIIISSLPRGFLIIKTYSKLMQLYYAI